MLGIKVRMKLREALDKVNKQKALRKENIVSESLIMGTMMHIVMKQKDDRSRRWTGRQSDPADHFLK